MMIDQLPTLDAKAPPEPRNSVEFKEAFQGILEGNLPKGWSGKEFAVLHDVETGMPALELKDSGDLFYVKLPPVALSGDFFVQCDFKLGSVYGNRQNMLSLSVDNRGGAPVVVVMMPSGNVTLGDGKPRHADGYWDDERVRLRLERVGKTYRVLVNSEVAAVGDLAITGKFDGIRIGLKSGGEYNAKIFSVKAGLLERSSAMSEPETPEKPEKAPERIAGVAGGEILETFENAEEGKLPSGWLPGLGNVLVTKNAGKPAMELNDPNVVDTVTLPPVKLKGAFLLECEFEMSDRTSALRFLLTGKEGRKPMLAVGMRPDGQLMIQERPMKNLSKELKVGGEGNKLTIERGRAGYIVRVGGGQYIFPGGVAEGEFAEIKLTIGPPKGSKNNRSPVIRSVKVSPTDGAGKTE